MRIKDKANKTATEPTPEIKREPETPDSLPSAILSAPLIRLVCEIVSDARHGKRLVCLGPAENPHNGELDLSTCQTLQIAAVEMIHHVKAEMMPTLCVDIRQVYFVDSAGMAVLLDSVKALLGTGITLRVLVLPGSQPERVLVMAGFRKVMKVVPLLLGSGDTAH